MRHGGRRALPGVSRRRQRGARAAAEASARSPRTRGPRTAASACAWACTRARSQRIGDEYVGLALHQVARIMSAGHGGQVLVSTTRATSSQSLPPRRRAARPRRARLKDLPPRAHLSSSSDSRPPATFPPLRTLDTRPNNLPVQLTSFVGRAELARPARLLAGTRLLTLTGPGGTGKTRLALQLAAELTRRLPGRRLLRAARRGHRPGPGAAGDRRRARPDGGRAAAARRAWSSTWATSTAAAGARQLRAGRRRRRTVVAPARASAGPAHPRHQPRVAPRLRRAGVPGAAAGAARPATRPHGRELPRSSRPCSSSSSGRGGPAGLRADRRERRRPSPRSVAGSTACRWRSSWPRRASRLLAAAAILGAARASG